MKHLIILLVCCCFSQLTFAQYGNINISADPKIEQLIDVHKSVNSRTTKTKGFRVQIIQDSNRDLVREKKIELLGLYPNMRAYETYEAPFYKLRLGDFTDRYDAYRVFKEVKNTFKRAFIVPDKVNISEL
ncbi:MAG: SPOR domain-containing protein [Chitinophagales bacterium]